MAWLSVTLNVDAGSVEALSDALLEAGAIAVDVADAQAGTPAERAMFGEPGEPATREWALSCVNALFDEGADVAAGVAAAFRIAGLGAAGAYHTERIADQDWVRATQSQFQPVRVSPRLWVVPTWHTPPDDSAINLIIDPGLAFGTGTHPTTRMCLRWIATRGGLEGQRVLDYGCGSGILAIGAAKYGATDIDAVDIDEAAVTSTRLNAEANGVQLKTGLPDAVDGRYQTVLANILATPLKVLAPLLCGRIAPGGALVLAGILERQADELKAAYAPYVELTVSDSEDGWILMTART